MNKFAKLLRAFAGRYAQLQFSAGQNVIMKLIIKLAIIVTVACSSFQSCKKEEDNPLGAGTNNNPLQAPHPTTKTLLHGSWRLAIGDPGIPYVVYDSLTSVFSEKRDHGFNFRSEFESGAKVDSDRLWWAVGDGTYEPWWWIRWSQRYDTLILSWDSLFRSRFTYTRDSNSADVNPWIENIPSAQVSFYPSITSDVRSLAYADSNWYVFTSTGWSDGKVHKVKLGDTTTTVYDFPDANAMDVSNGFLWLVSLDHVRLYLEKRRLADTTLLARYDISDYGGGAALAVSNDSVYTIGRGGLIVLTTTGSFVRSDSTYIGLADLALGSGKLWGVTNESTVYELDPATMRAKQSYYIAGGAFSTVFGGIAYHDGKIACADHLQGYLIIWETMAP